MIDLDIDMRQYDCPFIDTTDDVDIAFSAVQWQLDTDDETLETRLIARGDSVGALENGLHTLRNHSNMTDCYVLSKRGNVAQIGTTIEETNAMRTIQRNGGYITGPFQIENGREHWRVGFDSDEDEDHTLAELERHNEFNVEDRDQFGPAALFDLLDNSSSAMRLLEGCRSLTETERETFRIASQNGYYETPRETTLGELADHFGISKTAVSMNLRRSERKILQGALSVLDDIDDESF
ncbi:HTH-10 family transcription regulator [Natrialba magadii ATCC 43099]|uniref:Bacterio-opsin activator HTH domain-containing protein n=1 Tax=Natrialba magadii (strain ATCC 43099 / DSM 3394 / CCM 3739 / CIP 104546 / IAM 13178 / JCM 8861 / NBRC 102185 / NCIMB 2190 / MS3) TaxID=547559 RepID=D3SYH3_NATMM|nr:helix-turn-helix domain-containing protein [Natrialba magadii]ADD06144.1 HTH-10 family transcription regulator [Natrialba magadii ATCC 43099]ELY30857.1 bacterio-opsin activator HTH domain-containing protein [Natrialba magadii ATCC 43099]